MKNTNSVESLPEKGRGSNSFYAVYNTATYKK
jgi:hypothetical protein